jgi:SAM-dependent methyltransferase
MAAEKTLRLGQATKAAVKAIVPVALLSRIQQHRRGWSRQPPVGWVRFGSFRRLEPIGRDFGGQWGQVIDRYYIEKFLEHHASDIRGRVLEVADDGYTKRFGGTRVSQSDVLHYTDDNPKATIVADLTNAWQIPSNSFDCIILIQTLQFIFDLRASIKTLHRILKPGGNLLVTCHGTSQISSYDMQHWGEYWRLTSLSAHKLFTEVFPEPCVAVQAYGNVLSAIAFLHGIGAQELRPAELDFNDPHYEVLVAVRAVKPSDN